MTVDLTPKQIRWLERLAEARLAEIRSGGPASLAKHAQEARTATAALAELRAGLITPK